MSNSSGSTIPSKTGGTAATSNPAFLDYGLALGSCAIAFAITAAIGDHDVRPAYFAFVAAVAITSWYGGWRPGLVSLLLSFAVVAGWEYRAFHGAAALIVAQDMVFVLTSVIVWATGSSAQKSMKALRKTNSKFSGLVQISEDAIISVDQSHAITLFNPGAEAIFGYRQEELLGRPVHLLIPEPYRAMHAQHLQAFLAADDVLRPMAERSTILGLRKDGSEFPAEASISKFWAGDEMVLTVRLRDIAQRVEAERGLRQLASLVNSSDDAIFGQTLDGIVTSWNTGAEHMFGYSPDEIVGRRSSLLLPPADAEEMEQRVGQVKNGHSWKGEASCMRKDGKRIDVALTMSLISSHRGTGGGVSTVARDITERRTLEDQLRQSQKMEAIGRLAGGIAHDFNNLLSVIVGYSYLIHANSAAEDAAHSSAQEIMKAAEQAGSLTRQLLTFSRKQVLQPEVLDLNQVVQNLGKMLPRLIGEDIDLRIVQGNYLERVKLDPVQIEQVIMNLAVNSRDAMPKGGKLTIETANVFFDERDAKHHGVSPGDYVMLAVTDTGEGMDAETQKLIFEPFFTTKEPGKGTGLGLATVYGIVSQANGHIWVYSEPGNGTTFKTYFPTTAETMAKDREESRSKPVLCGTETVLVVEDSELLRNLITQFLGENGYKIMVACNGAEALALANECREPIDLLLTDVIMPTMGGQELGDKICQKYPAISILFMSGYTNNALIHQGAIEDGRSFLQKPFAPDVLLERVREVLDRATQRKALGKRAV